VATSLEESLGLIAAANELFAQADASDPTSVYPPSILLLGNWANIISTGYPDTISVVIGEGVSKEDASNARAIFGTSEMYPPILRDINVRTSVNIHGKVTDKTLMLQPQDQESVINLGFEILLQKTGAGTYAGEGAFTLAYNPDAPTRAEYNKSLTNTLNPTLNGRPVYLSARILKDSNTGYTLEIYVKSFDNVISLVESIRVFAYTYNSSPSAFRSSQENGGVMGTLSEIDPNKSQVSDNSLVSDIQLISDREIDRLWLDNNVRITVSPIWGKTRRNVYFNKYAFETSIYENQKIKEFYFPKNTVSEEVDALGLETGALVTDNSIAIDKFYKTPEVVRFYSHGNLDTSISFAIIEELIPVRVLFDILWKPSYERVRYREGNTIGTDTRFILEFTNVSRTTPSSKTIELNHLSGYADANIKWTYQIEKLNRQSGNIRKALPFNVVGIFDSLPKSTMELTDEYKKLLAYFNDYLSGELKWDIGVVKEIEKKQGDITALVTKLLSDLNAIFNYAFWQPSINVRFSSGSSSEFTYRYLEGLGCYVYDTNSFAIKSKIEQRASNLTKVGSSAQSAEIRNLISGLRVVGTMHTPVVLFGKFEVGSGGTTTDGIFTAAGIEPVDPWTLNYNSEQDSKSGVDLRFKPNDEEKKGLAQG